MSGLEICRRLRSTGSSIPVIFLTAKDEIGDRVAGLDAGADDYVVKPFSIEELLARIRAHLRRTQEIDKDLLQFESQATPFRWRVLALLSTFFIFFLAQPSPIPSFPDKM